MGVVYKAQDTRLASSAFDRLWKAPPERYNRHRASMIGQTIPNYRTTDDTGRGDRRRLSVEDPNLPAKTAASYGR